MLLAGDRATCHDTSATTAQHTLAIDSRPSERSRIPTEETRTRSNFDNSLYLPHSDESEASPRNSARVAFKGNESGRQAFCFTAGFNVTAEVPAGHAEAEQLSD